MRLARVAGVCLVIVSWRRCFPVQKQSASWQRKQNSPSPLCLNICEFLRKLDWCKTNDEGRRCSTHSTPSTPFVSSNVFRRSSSQRKNERHKVVYLSN